MLAVSANRSRTADQSEFEECHALLVSELPALRERARFLERNDAGADDLMHDTVEKALRYWSRFKPGTSVRAWLMRIMQNQFIDGWRHRRYFDERDLDQLPVPAPAPPPEGIALHLLVDLEDVVQVLPHVRPVLREVFELAYLQHLGQSEISSRLGVPTKTVATRLHRARRQIRTLLAAQLQAPAWRV